MSCHVDCMISHNIRASRLPLHPSLMLVSCKGLVSGCTCSTHLDNPENKLGHKCLRELTPTPTLEGTCQNKYHCSQGSSSRAPQSVSGRASGEGTARAETTLAGTALTPSQGAGVQDTMRFPLRKRWISWTQTKLRQVSVVSCCQQKRRAQYQLQLVGLSLCKATANL